MCLPVLLPHDVLQYLFEEVGLEISPDSIQKYWAHVREHCEWARQDGFTDSHIPVVLYGDTARYGQGFNQNKITGCYMSLVLWRPRSTRMSQWLLFSVDADLSLGPKTLNPLYRAVVASLNCAFDGRKPSGEPLCGKFCVTEVKGDWEYHWQTFRLCRYWRTRWICWRCAAENHASATHCFLDFQERPTWQDTTVSHNTFLVHMCKPDLV